MRRILIGSLFLLLSLSLFAQASSDPSNDFYTQVERWEVLGLIEKQPSLRPYALPVVEKILNQVIESDSDNEAEVAKVLYEKIFNRPWGVTFDATAYAAKSKLYDDGDLQKRGLAKYGLEGDVAFGEYVSAGYQLDFLTDVFTNDSVLPYNRYFSYFMADGKGKIKNYMEVDGNLALNFGNLYIQTGINHNSFGPFYADSLALSSRARHTANFALTYAGKNWSYTEGMFALTATSTEEALGGDPNKFPNKWLMLHNFDWNVNEKLSLSFYETVIYGQRFDPSYLVPMLYMVTQGVTGYGDDNLLMGGSFVYRPIAGLSVIGDFYLDDAGITGIKEYHDIKLHAAGALGVRYVPQNTPVVQMVKADYTLVTPFMYTHCQDDADDHALPLSATNYQMYTTAGTPIGSNLQPNSDRIALAATFAPAKGLKVGVGGAFIRHGNVTESLSKEEKIALLASPTNYYATDGSIRQHGAYGKHGNTKDDTLMPSANNKTMILTQDTKEYTLQGDLSVEYTLPATKAGEFTVGLGYTFELIKNYGVGNTMLPGQNWYYDNGKYYSALADGGSVDPTSEVDVDAALDAAYNSWKSALKDIMNHYLTISFKYAF